LTPPPAGEKKKNEKRGRWPKETKDAPPGKRVHILFSISMLKKKEKRRKKKKKKEKSPEIGEEPDLATGFPSGALPQPTLGKKEEGGR